MKKNLFLSKEELLLNLCSCDKRSPYYTGEDVGDKTCHCDNCFDGRHIMANELIMLRQKSYNE